MRTFIREPASVLPRPTVNDSGFPPAEALLTGGDGSTTRALRWLTVGLGLLVIGLAAALIVLAVVQ
jgi:hypothetical protein